MKSRYNILTLSTLVSLVAVVSLLTGCAGFMQRMGYQKTQKPEPYRCDNATVLLTNLTLTPTKRHYLLPDGRLCYFNLPQPKKRTFFTW